MKVEPRYHGSGIHLGVLLGTGEAFIGTNEFRKVAMASLEDACAWSVSEYVDEDDESWEKGIAGVNEAEFEDKKLRWWRQTQVRCPPQRNSGGLKRPQ